MVSLLSRRLLGTPPLHIAAATTLEPGFSIRCTMLAQAAGPSCSVGQAAIRSLPTRCTAPGALQARRQAPAAAGLSAGSSSAHGSSGSSGRRRQRCRAASAEGAAAGSAVAAAEAAPSSGDKGVPQSDVWELDFCSRPILDERGKKVGPVDCRWAGPAAMSNAVLHAVHPLQFVVAACEY